MLEQRIARAHRMGQKQPVQVYVLVTEGTIEENLLATLVRQTRTGPRRARTSNRRSIRSTLQSGMEELKRRLEVLLGAKPEAAVDESEKVRQQPWSNRRRGRNGLRPRVDSFSVPPSPSWENSFLASLRPKSRAA